MGHRVATCESSNEFERLIGGVRANTPKIRAFKRGLIPYIAYFIAHESHHRGNILLTLSGHALDKDASYAIWDWNRL